MIEVVLATGLICFQGQCHAALVGADTPRGEFSMVVQRRHEPMFRGDVLVFKEDARSVWAIHRAHNDKRRALLASGKRTGVTAGCVNVADDVYDSLRECCSNQPVRIY